LREYRIDAKKAERFDLNGIVDPYSGEIKLFPSKHKEERMAYTYRVEIIRNEAKDPLKVFLVTTDNIVDAAIEATQELRARKWSDEEMQKKVRVGKIEEMKAEMI